MRFVHNVDLFKEWWRALQASVFAVAQLLVHTVELNYQMITAVVLTARGYLELSAQLVYFIL